MNQGKKEPLERVCVNQVKLMNSRWKQYERTTEEYRKSRGFFFGGVFKNAVWITGRNTSNVRLVSLTEALLNEKEAHQSEQSRQA